MKKLIKLLTLALSMSLLMTSCAGGMNRDGNIENETMYTAFFSVENDNLFLSNGIEFGMSMDEVVECLDMIVPQDSDEDFDYEEENVEYLYYFESILSANVYIESIDLNVVANYTFTDDALTGFQVQLYAITQEQVDELSPLLKSDADENMPVAVDMEQDYIYQYWNSNVFLGTSTLSNDDKYNIVINMYDQPLDEEYLSGF